MPKASFSDAELLVKYKEFLKEDNNGMRQKVYQLTLAKLRHNLDLIKRNRKADLKQLEVDHLKKASKILTVDELASIYPRAKTIPNVLNILNYYFACR